MSVLSNGVLVATFSVFYALGKNAIWKLKRKSLFEELESSGKIDKVLTLLTGYRAKLSELERRPYILPLEEVSIEGGAVTVGRNRTIKQIWIPRMGNLVLEECRLSAQSVVVEAERTLDGRVIVRLKA